MHRYVRTADDENYIIDSSPFNIDNRAGKIRNKLKSTKLQIVTLDGSSVIVDNVGSYDPASGELFLVGFKPSSVIGGVNFIKIKAIPANQSAISPQREDILTFDEDPSFSSAVIVESV